MNLISNTIWHTMQVRLGNSRYFLAYGACHLVAFLNERSTRSSDKVDFQTWPNRYGLLITYSGGLCFRRLDAHRGMTGNYYSRGAQPYSKMETIPSPLSPLIGGQSRAVRIVSARADHWSIQRLLQVQIYWKYWKFTLYWMRNLPVLFQYYRAILLLVGVAQSFRVCPRKCLIALTIES